MEADQFVEQSKSLPSVTLTFSPCAQGFLFLLAALAEMRFPLAARIACRCLPACPPAAAMLSAFAVMLACLPDHGDRSVWEVEQKSPLAISHVFTLWFPQPRFFFRFLVGLFLYVSVC